MLGPNKADADSMIVYDLTYFGFSKSTIVTFGMLHYNKHPYKSTRDQHILRIWNIAQDRQKVRPRETRVMLMRLRQEQRQKSDS